MSDRTNSQGGPRLLAQDYCRRMMGHCWEPDPDEAERWRCRHCTARAKSAFEVLEELKPAKRLEGDNVGERS